MNMKETAMRKRITGFSAVIFFLLFIFGQCWGDLAFSREVVIAPKTGIAAANIGSVGKSYNIKMDSAVVDITVESVSSQSDSNILISICAVFLMQNVSSDELLLTVGFPISESCYSSFDLKNFTVVSNEEEKTVFHRIAHYPSSVSHVRQSGPDVPPETLPDAAVNGDIFGTNHARFGDVPPPSPVPSYKHSNMPVGCARRIDLEPYLSGTKKFSYDAYVKPGPISYTEAHNQMVWTETFTAQEERSIVVQYTIGIPKQKTNILLRKVTSNQKGIWKEEANNVPIYFLKTLETGTYYFFDYFLTSGSSWLGPIGTETVNLHLPDEWANQIVFCSQGERVIQTGATTWTYSLSNEEPQENLYFAVPIKE